MYNLTYFQPSESAAAELCRLARLLAPNSRHFFTSLLILPPCPSGSFGIAQLVKDKATGKEYVLKSVSLEAMSEDEQQKAFQEVLLLKTLEHVCALAGQAMPTCSPLLTVPAPHGSLYLSLHAWW